MSVIVHLLNGILMLVLPLGLGVFLARRMGGRWGLFGAGAVTFVASQVFHIPFNALVLNPRLGLDELGLPAAQTQVQVSGALMLAAVALGLSAGVFEELARYWVLRFWQRSSRSWRQALMFGAGHGGVEAIILGILALYGFFQALAYRGADLAAIVPADQMQLATEQLQAYWGLPWHQALLGALERLFALCLHLSLAVMVMRAFTHNNRLWLVAAIGWHAALDGALVVGLYTIGAINTEIVIGVFAALSVGFIFLLRDETVVEQSEAVARVSAGSVPSIAGLEAERIDDSRFLGP